MHLTTTLKEVSMNKQDYEKKTDFEINKMILEIESKKEGVSISNIRPHRLSSKLKALKCFGNIVVFDIEGESSQIDYCNNPSDMMPLAWEHGISLIHESCYWTAASDDLNEAWDSTHSADDKNPLRAAAIVYLLMQDEGE